MSDRIPLPPVGIYLLERPFDGPVYPTFGGRHWFTRAKVKPGRFLVTNHHIKALDDNRGTGDLYCHAGLSDPRIKEFLAALVKKDPATYDMNEIVLCTIVGNPSRQILNALLAQGKIKIADVLAAARVANKEYYRNEEVP